MSRVIVGRIFWKELRTLTALWLTLACVAVALEVAVAVWFTFSRPWWVPEKLPSAAAATLLVSYIAVILYAIATASAAFTSEIEGRHGTPFGTVPVTRLEAFLGKWSYGLGSTAALLVVLVVAALVVCAGVGWSTHSVSPWDRVRHAAPIDREPADVVVNTWMGVLLPVEFFALCALCSLLFSDVLMAAAFGSFVSVLASCGWWVGPVWANGLFVAAVIGADFWLTGVWLRRGAVAAWEPAGSPIDWPALSRLSRAWEPTAPWQRALYALTWKESRLALPFASLGLLAVLATTLHTAFDPSVNNPGPSTMLFRWTAHWTALLSIPLLMGLAAHHVEQKAHCFRCCGELGVAPLAAWFVKHALWLGLAVILCLLLLVLDRWAAAWAFDGFGRWTPHWDIPDSLLNAVGALLTPSTLVGTRLAPPPVGLVSRVESVALYIAMAYAIGQFFSFVARKAVIALGAALGGVVLICAAWAALLRLGVPSVWTVGVVPLALLGFTLSRTGRWQSGRVIWPQSMWLFVPLAVVLFGIVMYRMDEIPPLPAALVPLRAEAGPPTAAHDVKAADLWVKAAAACPSFEDGTRKSTRAATHLNAEIKDWPHVEQAEKEWVDSSTAAIALALEAARHQPVALTNGSTFNGGQGASPRWSRLARLLALSAREQESAGKLDQALLRYQAAVHLAVCLSHRYETWFAGREITCDTLVWMRAWAAHPTQTTVGLNRGMVAIVNLNSQTQRLCGSLQTMWRDWLDSNDKLSPNGPASLFSHPTQASRMGRVADPYVPWEAVRDRRIVNALFATTVATIDAVEARLGNGNLGGWVPVYGTDIKSFESDCLDVLRWLSTTPSMNHDQLLVAQDMLLSLVNWEAERRIDLIGVAIASFRREHGRNPVALNELASSDGWLNLCDPWTGREFCYIPGSHTARDRPEARALETPAQST